MRPFLTARSAPLPWGEVVRSAGEGREVLSNSSATFNKTDLSEGIMKFSTRYSLALTSLLALANAAHAQDKGCIELKTVAESEQEYVNEAGQKAKRLMPASKVVPGDEVVWTITAKNVCDKAADSIVIANPVPEQMSYIANSAMGVGADITYSLDGKDFKAPAALTVSDPTGASRAARADEFRAVRWTYKTAFAPGATAFVRYRALVK
jgi:uncharacterized repeat protein (TIGR01451 family)